MCQAVQRLSLRMTRRLLRMVREEAPSAPSASAPQPGTCPNAGMQAISTADAAARPANTVSPQLLLPSKCVTLQLPFKDGGWGVETSPPLLLSIPQKGRYHLGRILLHFPVFSQKTTKWLMERSQSLSSGALGDPAMGCWLMRCQQP